MKAIYLNLFSISFLVSLASYANSPVTRSEAFYVGPEGADVFKEYIIDKTYAELELTGEICAKYERRFLSGGCSIIQSGGRVQIMGSYPVMVMDRKAGKAIVSWACKVKNAQAGDRIQVRTICE